jgi:hypothetical protein
MSGCLWSRKSAKLAYGATFRAHHRHQRHPLPAPTYPRRALVLPLSFTISLSPLPRIAFMVLTSFSCPHGVHWLKIAPSLPQDGSRCPPSVHQVTYNSRECLKYNLSSLECDLKLECVKPTAHQGPRQAKNQESRAPSPQPSEECDLKPSGSFKGVT